MIPRVAWVPLFLVLLACGSTDPETFNGHVTFSIVRGKPSSDGPVTSRQALTSLAVEKQGRTPIVDAWQEEAGAGASYGRHRFPPHCGAAGVAAYYVLVLSNAGWESGVDYDFDEQMATLRFFGVQHLDAAADIDEIQVVVVRLDTADE